MVRGRDMHASSRTLEHELGVLGVPYGVVVLGFAEGVQYGLAAQAQGRLFGVVVDADQEVLDLEERDA